MSTADAPALIQYACERCKTRFVLPPSSRRLGLGGRLRAAGMAFGGLIRHRLGIGSGYDAARRQLLSKMDDDAYQSFVQSFKFCHECRQFVCSECWSNSRKTCLGCFAKAAGTGVKPRPPFAPEGPVIPRPVVGSAIPAVVRRRSLRTDASFLVMGAAFLLLAVTAVYILPSVTSGHNGPGAFAGGPTATPTAKATPTAAPTLAPTPTPTPVPTPTATPSPSPSPSPTASPSPSPSPSPTPTKKPAPVITATPNPGPPKITCGGGTGSVAISPPFPQTVQCREYAGLIGTHYWYATEGQTILVQKVISYKTSTFYYWYDGTPGITIYVVVGGRTSNVVTLGPA